MALAPDTLTFDTADPVPVATFWAAALDLKLEDPDPAGAFVVDPTGRSRGLFFQPVPEPKVVKNRVHLDLRAPTTMEAEVERMRELGAQEIRFVEEGQGFWTVMGDPEGNEFCVLRGVGEGARRDRPGLDSVVIDCDDWRMAADFWMAALAYRELEAGTAGVEIIGSREGDPMISLVHVPEPKTVKDRIHLDVRPSGSMAAEVARVEALGATQRGFIEVEGSFWTQMRDPEGNEFCILRGPEDGWTRDEL